MAFDRRDPDRRVVASLIGVFLLLVAFGDGLTYAVVRIAGLQSPWILLLPVGFAVVGTIYAREVGSLLRGRVWFFAAVIGWLTLVGLLLQLLAFQSINVAGYLQVAGFCLLVAVVHETFRLGTSELTRLLGQGFLAVLLFLTGYLVIGWLVYQATGADLSIVALFAGRDAQIYYGFRPAGWSAEPAWAAFAIAVSFTGAWELVPRARVLSFVALVAAAVALQSATLLVFVLLATMAIALSHRAALPAVGVGAGLTIGIVAVLMLSTRSHAILAGSDPSLQMRLASLGVGWAVVTSSFPFGVGYGNFREVAEFGAAFVRLIDVETATYYKTDFVLINLTAELGLAGIAVLVFLAEQAGVRRSVLAAAVILLLGVLSGTVLVPPVLGLAALAGALARQRQDRRAGVSAEDGRMQPSIVTSGPRVG